MSWAKAHVAWNRLFLTFNLRVLETWWFNPFFVPFVSFVVNHDRNSQKVQVKILLNGDEKQVADGTTIRQLLAQLNLVPEKVAIELNKRLARSVQYDQPLKQGDEIEIVTFVGGG